MMGPRTQICIFGGAMWAVGWLAAGMVMDIFGAHYSVTTKLANVGGLGVVPMYLGLMAFLVKNWNGNS